MENIRVYEVAKELGLTTKEMIEQLEKKIGVKVKSHSSTLTTIQYKKIKEAMKAPASTAPKKPKAFIVKKAKVQQPEAAKTTDEKTEQTAPDTVKKEAVKEEVATVKKDVVVEKSEQVQEKAAEEKTEVSETAKTPEPTSIRSLLEYNNQNSQKRRAEIMAENMRKKREQEKLLKDKRNAERAARQQQNPNQNNSNNPNRPNRGDGNIFQRTEKRFGDNNRPQRPQQGLNQGQGQMGLHSLKIYRKV